jgi:4a-hydroxytetrahydrobiopterin dehydratase
MEPKMELAAKKCIPCEGGTPPMGELEAKALLKEVEGWQLLENKIQKVFKFKDFKESMEFVNRVADLAEEEGHHPDILISWNKVTLNLTTHAIGGLSENDFIMAAKINKMRS